MHPVFPQLLQFSDLALLCLRLMVAVVFFESGRRHAGRSGRPGREHRPEPRIHPDPGVGRDGGGARCRTWRFHAGGCACPHGVMLGAIQKKLFVWHIGFWGDKTYGWHYDLLFVVANLVILTTGGGRFRPRLIRPG